MYSQLYTCGFVSTGICYISESLSCCSKAPLSVPPVEIHSHRTLLLEPPSPLKNLAGKLLAGKLDGSIHRAVITEVAMGITVGGGWW